MKLQISKIYLLLILLSVSACRSNEAVDTQGNREAVVKVNVSGTEFVDAGEINPQTSNGKGLIPDMIQRRTLKLGDDLFLTAELVPVAEQQNRNMASSGGLYLAATQDPLPAGIKYKVIVFKTSDGSYVTEKTFTRGDEVQNGALKLDGGVTYTFIVYSVNSSKEADFPVVSFSDQTLKTLETATLQKVSGNLDFMYYRQDLTPSGEANANNRLDVILKHKFSKIITVLNATAIGYGVGSVTANFNPHYPTADIKLSDAGITHKGTTGNTPDLVFSNLNTTAATANTILLNGGTATGRLTISAITINGLTKNNISFSGLKIAPGVKYTMNINFTSNDENTTVSGQQVAVIEGKTWMRYNVGASGSPDSPSQSLIGNYIRWGEQRTTTNLVGNIDGFSATSGIRGWIKSENTNAGAWNSGNETSPRKTGSDPCPPGFRVPSVTEFNHLLANTTQSNAGNWGSNSGNFAAAKVFTSKKNANVKLTFPIAGYLDATFGDLFQRGLNGYYWAGSGSARNFQITSGGASPGTASTPGHAESVRCIKE